MSEINAFYQRFQTDDDDLDRLSKVLREAVAVHPQTALDIGCGRGFLLSQLQSLCPLCRLFGVEISSASAAEVSAKGVTVFQQSVTDGLPLDDGSIDLVIMGEVIEHLFDPDATLDEIRRILAPGGTLIVTTPNLAGWANRILLLFGVQPLHTETSTRKKYGRVFKALGNRSPFAEGHLRIYTKAALVEMVSDLGFDVRKVMGACFAKFARFPGVPQIDRMFSKLPSLASLLIVVATKK